MNLRAVARGKAFQSIDTEGGGANLRSAVWPWYVFDAWKPFGRVQQSAGPSLSHKQEHIRMPKSLAVLIKEATEAVNDVPDALKAVAFEKAFDALLAEQQGGSENPPASAKRRQKTRTQKVENINVSIGRKVEPLPTRSIGQDFASGNHSRWDCVDKCSSGLASLT